MDVAKHVAITAAVRAMLDVFLLYVHACMHVWMRVRAHCVCSK